jgi:hypothetical protein
VALLPGSKRAKLQVGVPFLLETADRLAALRPGCRFLLPVAPTTSVDELLAYAGPGNPMAHLYTAGVPSRSGAVLLTAAGTEIHLRQEHPAHGALSQCRLALTTVGANTAELGALGLPMIVLVPTQHLHVMQAWDGWLGLVARLPLLRRLLGVVLTAWRMRHRGFLAWPNISAGRAVVPERVGAIEPASIAAEAAEWLAQPLRLAGMRDDLRSLRGRPGAVAALAAMVQELLPRSIPGSGFATEDLLSEEPSAGEHPTGDLLSSGHRSLSLNSCCAEGVSCLPRSLGGGHAQNCAQPRLG